MHGSSLIELFNVDHGLRGKFLDVRLEAALLHPHVLQLSLGFLPVGCPFLIFICQSVRKRDSVSTERSSCKRRPIRRTKLLSRIIVGANCWLERTGFTNFFNFSLSFSLLSLRIDIRSSVYELTPALILGLLTSSVVVNLRLEGTLLLKLGFLLLHQRWLTLFTWLAFGTFIPIKRPSLILQIFGGLVFALVEQVFLLDDVLVVQGLGVCDIDFFI